MPVPALSDSAGLGGGARVRAATGVVVYTRAMFRALVFAVLLLVPAIAGAQDQAPPAEAGPMTDSTPEEAEEPRDPNDPFTAGTPPEEGGLGFGTTLMMLTEITSPQEPIVPHVPQALRRVGPQGLELWQWMALPIALIAAAGLGRMLGFLTRALALRIARRTRTQWDDDIVSSLSGPASVAWGLAAFFLILPWLALPHETHLKLLVGVRVGFMAVFFWGLWKTIEVVSTLVLLLPWAIEMPASRSLVPLAARAGKLTVMAMGVIATFSLLGYPVASLLAGLGIGGLALALAAQKTVENLFGSVSLAVDQPIRVGDFVKVENDVMGTVESIGLRSTRLRTLDRTVVAIPNGKLADMRLESFAVRDRLRLFVILNLVYGTTAAQMRQILAEVRAELDAHPKIFPEGITVVFRSLGESSVDIEVTAWFQTFDWNEFVLIRQEMLLRFMEIVEKAGSSFAFPTRTLVMQNSPTFALKP